MNLSTLSISTMLLIGGLMAGCENDTPGPPKGAMRPPERPAVRTEGKTTWTTEEKIAAIQGSSLSAEQKKTEIAKISRGQ